MNSRFDMVEDIEKIYNLHSPKVLKVLKKIPREEFIPQKYRYLAYEDTAISIGEGQTISQPFTVAFMTHLLSLRKNEKVLEIGTGSGYQAAVLSFLSKEVYTIERIESLAEKAKKVFKKLNIKNIQVKVGQGEKGWKEHAPFDAILITANTKKVPSILFKQLKEGGRIVSPIGEGTKATLTRYTKKDKRIKKEEYGNYLFVPLIEK